ncbi:hypothetical protein BRAS3843_1010009 [Bradyrhizobium sp. STM 3843]|nr:hypothetical protein BRAS3843_1010009 [Bradyrhizobium sp. STM 3843]
MATAERCNCLGRAPRHLTLTTWNRHNTAIPTSKSLIFAGNVLYMAHSQAEPGHAYSWPPF